MTPSLEEVIEQISELAAAVDARAPEHESLEWYVANNLREAITELRGARHNDDIERVRQKLSRFAADSLDWSSDIFKRVTDLTTRLHSITVGDKMC